MPETPDRFLPLGNLPYHVLLSLGSGASHGYAIGKEIERRSSGKLQPTTGSLYQALKRLADDELIERAPEAARISPDSRRQYFRLTDLGREVVRLETARLHELVRLAVDLDLYPSPG